jgi:hypothetical protein
VSPLLVVALIVASLIVEMLAPTSPFVARASKIGGFAFILYGIVLGFIYLMGLVGHG